MLARVLLLYAKVLFFKANARTAAFDYANAVGHGCLISAGCHILPAMLSRKASRSPTGFIEPCRPIEGYKAAVRPAVGSGDEARRLPPHVRLISGSMLHPGRLRLRGPLLIVEAASRIKARSFACAPADRPQ
jgi:hypothetical protein